MTRLTAAIAFAVSTLSLASPLGAQGQNGGDIDLNAFRPAVDSRGYITVNASQVLGHKEVSFGLVTNWGHQVLKFDDNGSRYEVRNIFTPTLVGAFGFKIGPLELQLGTSIPFGVMSGDRDPDSDGGTPANPNDDANFRFEGQGIGDIAFHLKTRFLNTSRAPGIGLGIIASIYLPTASEEDSWLGDRAVTPQFLGVLDKEFGDEGRFRMALTGGIRIRSGDHEFVDMPTTGVPIPPATMQRIEVGTSVPFGVGLAYGLVPQKFEIVGEVFGDYALDGENYFPLEGIAGLKLYLAKNSFLTFGGGVGFLPDEGGNPVARAFLGIVFEPSIGDRDGDGLKDDIDRCPDDPEDKDGFNDEDGCPDPDNDRDGIPDIDDECPNEPEDKDGFEDDDGCPEGNQNDRDGDGILDEDDKCPDDPEDKDGFQDEDGCPDPDNDEDGILDVDDLCPDDAEDIDNFEDSDGCPDPDNDQDRIADVDDECPRKDGESLEDTKEVYNGFEDEDGCPDRGRVVVTDTKIEILDKIYFEYNKAIIKSESFPILDAIAATLQGNPDILLVEIQGHTDERGSDKYNLELSDKRSAAVREYLEKAGVDPGRLQSQGYGESQPVDPRHNEEAWAANRRVEFLILKRVGE